MIKTMRAAFVAVTMLLAAAPAFVAMPAAAALRAVSKDHTDKSERTAHKDHDRKHADHKRSHRKKHKKPVVVCITAPCPGDIGKTHRERKQRESDEKLKKEKCGTLILPTAGCGTPARDPVGNTRPTLPERTKQPVGDGRKPVLENVK